jgi:Na+-driven multidrug efflux pump
MKNLKSSIYSVVAISLVFFLIIAMIPWHPSKNGELMPYASPYVNTFMWGTLWYLIPHVLLSLLLGVGAFWGYETLKRRRSSDHTSG